MASLRDLVILIFSICKKFHGVYFRERNHFVQETCVPQKVKIREGKEEKDWVFRAILTT